MTTTKLGDTGIRVERDLFRSTVIEDRWGLRWRADTRAHGPHQGEPGWQCRSVDLRVWRSDEQMLDRGPLRFIRVDAAFAGAAATAAREAGHAEDQAVTVDGAAFEDAEETPVPGRA